MSNVLEGVVRGGKIVLVDGTELADGVRVQVVIEPQPVAAESATLGPTPEEDPVLQTPLEDPALIQLLASIRRDLPSVPPSPSLSGQTSAAGMLADDPTWDEHLREVLESRKTAVYRKLSE